MTNAQTAMLARLIQDGPQVPPGGYPGAHIDASAFWRTAEALQRRGYVKTKTVQGGGVVRITPEGRAVFYGMMERRLR